MEFLVLSFELLCYSIPMQQLILLDETVTSRFATFVASQALLAKFFVIIGVGLIYLMPLLFIIVWFAYSRKLALRVAITGLLAWQGLNKLIASLVDRPRPALSQIGTKELVFHRPDTSFPSDHSAFLMAIALTFYFSGQPRLGTLVLGLAILVGITRVGIGVHFVSDILAGWLVGALVAVLLQLIAKPLDTYLLEPGVHLARKLRL